MPRKTLAEELAELANPAPTKEYDPDADVFGAGPALEASDDELEAEVPTRRKAREQGRLHGDIVMEGKEYDGRHSSRSHVFDTLEANPLFSPHGSDDDASSDRSEEYASEDDDGGIRGDRPANGAVHVSAEEPSSRSESEKEKDNEGEEGDDSQPAAWPHGAGADGDEMAALERDYEAMQAAEVEASAGLKERAVKERRKALAVAAQRAVWQRGLEARILLQKALQGANRLPRGGSHAAVRGVDAQLGAGLEGVGADASGLLGDLLSLLGALQEQNPAVAQAAEAAGVKRKRAADEEEEQGGPASERLWARLDAAYQGFAPFRDASIDRWHRKTVLTAGGAGRGNLTVLNQSVSTQVAMVMRDARRVVQRTRLPKRQCRALCSLEGEGRQELRPLANVNVQKASIDAAGDGVEERDPETYDDTDFYQTLLKEFLEGSNDAGTANWYSGPKHRKAVDRRASKGRKLRYHIHDKLVNFVTPVELRAPQFASNIFANLFGGGGGGSRRR